jgi:hypothetical protein
VQKSGYDLVKFFFLLTFAAAIPAIVSGGIAERARFGPQLAATFLLVGFVYPFFEGIAWNQAYGIQAWLKAQLRRRVPRLRRLGGGACGRRLGRPGRRVLLGARRGRYHKDGGIAAHPPSSIPFLALGAWILIVGWFGFNVMSAQTLDKISGLVAMNSLMAMVGGTLAALVAGKNDPGFVHNGPLAGLVAVCAGSDLMHPLGALITGGVAGGLFVYDVHPDAEPLEDRRRARRLAAARPVRRLGRHRRRHLRRKGAGRPRRRRLHEPARRHRAGHRWPGRRLRRLWPKTLKTSGRPAAGCRGGIQRRRPLSIHKISAPARSARRIGMIWYNGCSASGFPAQNNRR